MNKIEEIFNNIDFKIHPDQNYRKEYIFRLKKNILSLINKDKEFLFSNTIIKKKSLSDEVLKKELLKIPSMSTFAIGYVINKICQSLRKEDIYVNIGVWKGFSLIAGMINTECIVHGVDNFAEFGGPKEEFLKNFEKIKNPNNHFFSNCDYKFFLNNFEKQKKPINFYFYDGEHSYENQFENLIIAKEFFIKGTIVLVDDINFKDVEMGTKDFINKYPGQYEILKEIKTANDNCHPSYWNGVIVFKKI